MPITVYIEDRTGMPRAVIITVPEGDEDRAEFLQACSRFYDEWGRLEDAEKFRLAIRQVQGW